MQHNVEVKTLFRSYCSNSCPGFAPELYVNEFQAMTPVYRTCTVSCANEKLCRSLMANFEANRGEKDVAEPV